MIKIKSISEPIVELYFKNELIGEIKSILSFCDVLVQIKEEGVYGYKVKYNGVMINIDKNGVLEEYPKGLYDQMTDLLIKLV